MLAVSLALAALGAPNAPLALASPGTYKVDRTDDVLVTGCKDLTPMDCSLRGAVQNANANPGSTIELAPSAIYVLTSGSGELVLSMTTTLNSANGLCLIGACAGIIKGGPGWSTRLLDVAPGAAVTVDHVEFTGGNANNGGAIMNSGTLTLTTSQIFSNTVGGWGGGILNFGTLTVSNTVINGNTALTLGGAIANQADVGQPGTVTIINSLIVTNTAFGPTAGEGNGGGIASLNNISGTIHPVLNIFDSSILTNTGTITGFGGGLFVDGAANLTNVTLQGNSAAGGGGAYVHFGQLNMQGGTVVSNTALTSAGSGGGFRNDGLLILNSVLVSGNKTLGGGAGGGISSGSPFTVTGSTLTHNSSGNGGAIWLAGPSALLLLDHSNLISNTAGYGAGLGGYGTATITNSSVISDNAGFQGGGINLSGGASLLLAGNSQVRNNTTTGGSLGSSNGAGIFNNSHVTIQNATVSGNVAGNGGGAGLYNNTGSTASLTSAALVGNHGNFGPGGGIANLGVLTITASAIVSNSTVASGGGISNTGQLSLLNTTLSGNTASVGAGGVVNTGSAALNFVTVARNTGSGAGGLANSGTLTLSNSLLGDNFGTPFDCSGTITSLGYNLIGHATGCTLSGPGTGDKKNNAPLITDLIDQGGALRFHDLLDFSPALESADPAGGACPATDQRGVARPIHPRCDIGAIESSAVAYYYLFLPLIMK